MFENAEIIPVNSPELTEAAKMLFRDYEKWLNVSLCFQGFEEEVNTLPGKYAPPEGRLYIVRQNEKYTGTIALRKIDEGICEMKRLYLIPECRGKGIGHKLVSLIIDDARKIGYKKMRLDTIKEKMPKAVEIYKKYGFKEIEPYYHNPNPHTLFMELDLTI
ncbi:MAG: GCN5-related N-acetyltransferase [Chlorobi bacterium OLB5]|nr:MAG: GCN5-related N-acetyltransferase [Chlorobi bacterium OLB5]